MSEMIEFTASLQKAENNVSAYVEFPFDVQALFGTRGNVPVKILYDEVPHRGLLANMGGGVHCLGINKALKTRIGKEIGETVRVRLERDPDQREVALPADLAAAFETDPEARALYAALAYSHRREYVQWITEAKKTETRGRRIVATIDRLKAGKKQQ